MMNPVKIKFNIKITRRRLIIAVVCLAAIIVGIVLLTRPKAVPEVYLR